MESAAPGIVQAENHLDHTRLARRLKLVGAGVLAVVLAAAATWQFMHEPVTVKYSTARVTQGAITHTVAATGTVNPVMTIIVGSYVSGVISDMYCDYNTRVKNGQVCARVDARPYRAALEQARGQLARDTAQLEGAQANLRRYAELASQDSIARQT